MEGQRVPLNPEDVFVFYDGVYFSSFHFLPLGLYYYWITPKSIVSSVILPLEQNTMLK